MDKDHDREAILAIIRDELTIEIDAGWTVGSGSYYELNISLVLGGERISSASTSIDIPDGY